MADFLIALTRINLVMGAAIFAVWLLRRPVRAAFQAQIAYGLWLLVPVAVLAGLLPPPSAAPGTIAPASLAIASGTLPLLPSSPQGALLDWSWLLFAGWLAGAFAMAFCLLRLQHQFHVAERAGLAGPAVTGFLRPRIILPAGFAVQFSATEQAAILAHEHAHMVQQDARINALAALLRCLCWFNPLVHLGAAWLRHDQELACDIAALRAVSRVDYANALLKSQVPSLSVPLGCTWPGSEHPLTERVALLKCRPPRTLRRWAGVCLVALTAAMGGVGAWAAQPAAQDPGNVRFSIRAVDETVRDGQPGPAGDDRVLFEMPGGTTVLWLKREGQINADARASAEAASDENGKPVIQFRLTAKGDKQFAALTRVSVGHRIAIVVKNRAIMAPVVQSMILSGRGQLTVSTQAQAKALAAEMMGKR